MKIAVTGKGGVGKSTIAAMLARQFAADGRKVIALDGDPDANLARCLGISDTQIENIVPLAEMRDFIAERTETKGSEGYGVYFKLNPKVDDIPDKFCVSHQGVKFLQVGGMKKGGSGCYCPENALLRQLMAHVLIQREDVVIMDMEAGFEHLSRGTSGSVDLLLVVVEPSRLSIETAKRIKALAQDLGIPKVAVVANKIRTEADKQAIEKNLPDLNMLGFLPYDERLPEADLQGVSPFELESRFKKAIRGMYKRVVREFS